MEMEKVREFHAALASGSASFAPEGAREIMRWWAGFAHQCSEKYLIPSTDGMGLKPLAEWAKSVLREAEDAEGGNAPSAGVREDKENPRLIMTWNGTFTRTRWVRVEVTFDNDEEIHLVVVSWDSGTGRPSRFLGVEQLFALPACYGWEVAD